jgi:hypothetical protein
MPPAKARNYIDKAWNILYIFKTVFLTAFSVLFIALFGGVFLPVSGNFVADLLLWFVLSAGSAYAYVRTAHAYRRGLAMRQGKTLDLLSTLSDIVHEVLGLLGGGFFGILFGYAALNEFRKVGRLSGDVLLMAGLTVVSSCAFGFSLMKFLRYQRAATIIVPPDPPK